MSRRSAVPPQRYIALLRAINVGNVLFDSPEPDTATLEQMIEARLEKELGYEVTTFLRKPAELSAIVSSLPFADDDLAGGTLSVAFLKQAPSAASAGRVHALQTETDDLLVRERELYWRCRGRTMDSKVWRTPLEKVIGMPATFRNITTVRKLAARC
jgi:uncharacterized protein (DUF1697 family)